MIESLILINVILVILLVWTFTLIRDANNAVKISMKIVEDTKKMLAEKASE